MPPERNEAIYLQDILKAVSKIVGLTEGMDFKMFCKDERTIDSVLYNFTIIGEASRHVTKAIHHAYPEIPWIEMRDMRNLVVHEYFGVDLQIVWKTIRDDLPQLAEMLKSVLNRKG
jgi:uncharacterized protein with HEPN domain